MAGCSSSPESNQTVENEKATSKVIIYQMMTRLFGNKNQTNKPYGTLEENGVGKFSDISDKALSEIRDLGITHVWYTGVIEHALLTDYTKYGIPLDDADVVKGRAGSPYSIKDYYDVNPDLADDVPNRLQEFEVLIRRTHANDLKVLIDFVPNHVARKYSSDARPKDVVDFGVNDDVTVKFSPSNNFYYLPGEKFQPPPNYQSLGAENSFPTKDGRYEEIPARVTGNDKFTASPEVDDWFESVKLNYGVDIENGGQKYFEPIPDTWIKMRDILTYWTTKEVDGFRCDMAEMVPVEFWQWVIPQIKEVNPQIIFIAEIYNPQSYRDYIQRGKFDYLYDKVQLYDTLRLLIDGKSSTKDIPAIQESLQGINHRMLHFLENHDEQRIASPFFAGDPWRAIPAMVVSAMIDQGPVMIYFGQEVGEPGIGAEGFSGEDGRTTHYDYWGVPEHQKWMNGGKFDGALLDDHQKKLRSMYRKVLNLARSNSAIVDGSYADLTASNIASSNFGDDVFSCLRWNGNEVIMIVAGFSDATQKIVIEIPSSVANEVGFSSVTELQGDDMLGSETKISFTNLKADLVLSPYGYHVFNLSN